MNGEAENKPARVSATTKQVGEARKRYGWAEPAVWTERMLTALETGVKGNVWFSLIDKVYSPANLAAAYRKVAANKGAAGVDGVSIEMYRERLAENLEHLHGRLKEETYQPQAIRRKLIPKAGREGEYRALGIPTIQDRVVQTALRNVLEPVYEKGFAEHSYGFRPERGCKDALRRVDCLLKQGYQYVVDADFQSYFDTIPHDKLMNLVRNKIADGRVLKLINAFLNQKIMEGLEQWTPVRGTPQGAVISPLLSNIYLAPLDHFMVEQGFEMVRYADDQVILCQRREDAEKALEALKTWTERAGLALHPAKTRSVDAVKEGFDFLGYRFIRTVRIPSNKSKQKLKNAIRGKTKRTRGKSLATIILDVNKTLRGWFEYFKHSRRYEFRPLDQWLRTRLRSILRKQAKMKGIGLGGENNIRWPNSFFAKYGLFNLEAACIAACQSAQR